MALKTFNIDERIYKEFSNYCKKHGISMSRRVENFIRVELNKVKKGVLAEVTESIEEAEHSFKKYC